MPGRTMVLLAPALVPVASPRAVLAARDAVVIDLRSPGEFALDHLPGASNVPLFDDAQRAIVGTLYARSSPDAALAEARKLVRGHLDMLVREIARLGGDVSGFVPPAVAAALQEARLNGAVSE